MKKIFFVKKEGFKRTIEEVRTVMGKASDKKTRGAWGSSFAANNPPWFDMSLFKDSF